MFYQHITWTDLILISGKRGRSAFFCVTRIGRLQFIVTKWYYQRCCSYCIYRYILMFPSLPTVLLIDTIFRRIWDSKCHSPYIFPRDAVFSWSAEESSRGNRQSRWTRSSARLQWSVATTVLDCFSKGNTQVVPRFAVWSMFLVFMHRWRPSGPLGMYLYLRLTTNLTPLKPFHIYLRKTMNIMDIEFLHNQSSWETCGKCMLEISNIVSCLWSFKGNAPRPQFISRAKCIPTWTLSSGRRKLKSISTRSCDRCLWVWTPVW